MRHLKSAAAHAIGLGIVAAIVAYVFNREMGIGNVLWPRMLQWVAWPFSILLWYSENLWPDVLTAISPNIVLFGVIGLLRSLCSDNPVLRTYFALGVVGLFAGLGYFYGGAIVVGLPYGIFVLLFGESIDRWMRHRHA